MTNETRRPAEIALDNKIASTSIEVLKECFEELRAKRQRSGAQAIVLGKLADEIERRVGEAAFDAYLDEIEAGASA